MVAISASVVKLLRERTGLGMMDCKQALIETQGDMELAIETLRKSSGMKAAKKANRIARDGLLGVKIDGAQGVLVEVNCETDFAARDENFIAFVHQVVEEIFNHPDANLDNLLVSAREALIQKLGENISVRRAEVFQDQGQQQQVAEYIHTNGKLGVLLATEGGSEALGKDLAMHIAALSPAYLDPDSVPAELIATEREIYAAQAEDSGKPPEIVEKIIQGRIKKYLAEISLTAQTFVKDGSMQVGALLKQEGARVTRFVRFEVGEGIEKKAVDFATEVKQQLNR